MEQIIQQYIQAKGLNEQQAQQLIQELQQLDEQQLQQVIGNMQQQLQGNNQEEQMMQYGGSNKSWINSYGHKMEKTGENGFKIYSKPKLALKQKENLNTEIFNNEDSFSDFDLLPKGQFGEKPTYKPLKYKYDNKGRKIALLNDKNEVIREIDPATGRPKYGNPFKKVGKLLGESLGEVKTYLGKTYDKDGVLGVVDEIMSAPTRGVTKAITGKYQDPSEALDIKNPYAKLAVDMILDPTNLLPTSVITKGLKVARGAKAMKMRRVIDPVYEAMRQNSKRHNIVRRFLQEGDEFTKMRKYADDKGLFNAGNTKYLYERIEEARKMSKADPLKAGSALINDLINIDKPDSNKPTINNNPNIIFNTVNSNTPNRKKLPSLSNNTTAVQNKPQYSIPKSTEVKNTNSIVKPEVSIDSVSLPSEEIYIQPTFQRRPRRYTESIQDYEDSFKNVKPSTSGQQRYELNDDYIRRLHQENVYGIKQAPKLIRNQYGGIPVSMDGLYEYENTPVIVPNGNITMEGIDYPVDAYNADTGEFLETMYPDEDYNFDANNVLEIPKGKFGISKMQSGGKVKLKKNAEGVFIGNDGNKYGYDESRNQFYKINTFTKEIVPNEDIEVENFNLTDAEKNKFLKNNLPEVIVKSRRSNSPNYFQPFNNIPLTSQLNFNSQGYESVDNKKQKPSTKKDEYSFVSDLSKVSEKSRRDNIAAYKSWTEEWNRVIPNFKSLPYDKQQEAVLNWMKTNQSGLNYDNVIRQLKNWGYTQNPESLLKDGMFAEGTSLMRPSNLIGKEEPLPLVEDVVFPNANTNQQSSVQEIPEVALPKEEGVDESNDEVNMDDVVLGKLNNNDYSGRYLSNMKLRNNIIKLPYFGRTDLKIPGVYTQNISPYLNEIYSVNNAYKQNTDLNSAIGQAAQMQLGANTMDRINKISGSVYNNNQQQKVNWENSLAGIYNQQQQVDEQNRRNYDDDVNRTIANKQNIDNIIDRMAYEFKQIRIRNKNNMLLSQMLHPNYVITDDGTMIRKPSPFNKGYADYLQEQNEKLSKENEELKTRVAKYGIKRRKK